MLKAGLIGTLGGVVAVAIAFFIGDAVSGPLLVTPLGSDAPEELELVATLFFTVFGGVVGVGLAALVKRFAGNPVPAFVGLCVVGLIAFGALSFGAAEEVATGVWLNIFHIAAAIPIVGLLAQATSSSPPLERRAADDAARRHPERR